jgi:hypothetical protein
VVITYAPGRRRAEALPNSQSPAPRDESLPVMPAMWGAGHRESSAKRYIINWLASRYRRRAAANPPSPCNPLVRARPRTETTSQRVKVTIPSDTGFQIGLSSVPGRLA